jgi:hypothetical protein
VETDQIKKQVLKFFHAASAVIDNFADRVHVQLAEMTDPDDVYKFLLEEMDVLKENIRNAISNSGPGKGDSGSNQHSVPEEAPVDRIAVGG